MGRPAVLKVLITADAKGVKQGTSEADSALSRLGRGAGKAGALIGAGIGAGAVAVGAFAVSAVGAASDVQQSFGALESVYGKNAEAVKRWASSAAKDVGLSKNEYAELAGVVGAQLTGMGKSTDQAATQTKGLIKMGADLSATFGGSVSDAVEAVSSLLKGEADPIERYGVSIKQSDVAARLAAEGHDKLTGAALKTAQANATLALLTEKTTAAHGAFSRETDTLAHQQQVLGAQFTNVKATVGAALLPALTGLFSFIGTKVVPVVQRLAGRLATELQPTMARASTFLSTVLVPAFRSLSAFVTGTLVPAIGRYLSPIIHGLGNVFASVTGAIEKHRDSFAKLQKVIGPLVTFIATKVYPVIGTLLGGAFTVLGKAIGIVLTVLAKMIDLVDSAVGKVKDLANTIKHSPLGKGISAVGGLFGGHAPVHPMGVPLTGGVGGLDHQLGSLATASTSGDPTLAGWFGGSGGGGGLVVVDRRDLSTTLTVDGALDGPSVARQLQQLLDDHAVRLGRLTAYAGGRA